MEDEDDEKRRNGRSNFQSSSPVEQPFSREIEPITKGQSFRAYNSATTSHYQTYKHIELENR